MRNYGYFTEEVLLEKKEHLLADIAEFERVLKQSRSFLFQLSLRHAIKRANEKIHAIDAELIYRQHKN